MRASNIGLWLWIPAFAGMTPKISRELRPWHHRLAARSRPSHAEASSPPTNGGCRESQASAEACGPRAAKKHAAEPQVSRTTRPSLRNGFTAYTQSPRRPGLFATVATTRFTRCADLSVGRPGPCDFTVRKLTYVGVPKHAAPHRGHRIPHPTPRDVRAAPLFNEAGCPRGKHRFRKMQSEIFFTDHLDRPNQLECAALFCSLAHEASTSPRWP
jgi:hypothetical protein